MNYESKQKIRVQVLRLDDLFNQPRYKVIGGEDGYTLLSEVGKIIASNINSKQTIPESKAVLKENKEARHVTQTNADSEGMDGDTSEDEQEGKITKILTVPEDLIDKIIRESGTTIKTTKAKSKAFIKIDTLKERGIERDGADITGTRESVTTVKEMRQKIIYDTEPKMRKSRK